MSSRPTLEEFIGLVRSEFAFLVSEFGFTEEKLPGTQWENNFQVRFVNPACRIVVEGLGFGTSVGITFERRAGGHARLLEILAARCPGAFDSLRQSGDQRALLRLAASSIRQHTLDAIRGESEVYCAAEARRQQMVHR